MERALRIESYRNIGFEDGKPSSERLVINNSLNKGELGDLIILIGANNSGKSNVLDALSVFGNSQIKDRDITDLFMEEECRKPVLTLFARNEEKEDEFAYKKIYKKSDEIILPKEKEGERELQFVKPETFLESLHNLIIMEENTFRTSCFTGMYKSLYSNHETQPFSPKDLQEAVKSVFAALDNLQKQNKNNGVWTNFLSRLRGNEIIKEYADVHNIIMADAKTTINKKYNEKYTYNFLPNIIHYEDEDISNDDLITNYYEIENDSFFSAVFNSIDVDISTIKNTYETFTTQHNRGQLIQLERKINRKLKTVADKFNRLYYMEDVAYSFSVILESERIFFSLFRGEQSISLDYQSTGFKWFFNLFFNLLNSTDLEPGDIIIMDEPATNLHVKGQKELRGFLKEFAIKNDISIIIATHSPFLIDLDYLEEIRVIVNKDNVSSIENNFAAVNENDPDSLLPIKESLTVENYILVNPDEKVVFVEGITDYNYLTAFKKLFGKTGIYFLPINGVGKTKEDCTEITKRLMKIRKKDPILLVDNDKAGSCMKEVNKDNKDFKVISLKEINDSFKEIESLFAKDDLEKFNLIDSDGQIIKHASTSSVFKNHILKNKDSITDETKNNFKNLFDKLEELTE